MKYKYEVLYNPPPAEAAPLVATWSYGQCLTLCLTREQFIGDLARRWFGITPPRPHDLVQAEARRAEVMLFLADRIPLFPPPPPCKDGK